MPTQSKICSMSCWNMGTFGRMAWSPTSFLTNFTRVAPSSGNCFAGLGWLFEVCCNKKKECPVMSLYVLGIFVPCQHITFFITNICLFLNVVRLSTSQSLEKRPTQLFPKWMEARPFVVKRRLQMSHKFAVASTTMYFLHFLLIDKNY